MKQLRFFVEITDNTNMELPLIQSPMFNTVQEAIDWRRNLAYVTIDLIMWLMIAEVDEKGELVEVVSSERMIRD